MGLSNKEKLERFFLAVINEQRKGRGADFLRLGMRYLSYLYGAVMASRNFLYEKGIFRHHTLGCQVISIGNLTVG